MSAAAIGGLLCGLLLAGCAGVERTAPRQQVPVNARAAAPVAVTPVAAEPVAAPVAAPTAAASAAAPVVAAPAVAPSTPTAAAATSRGAAKPAAAPPRPPAKTAAAPAYTAPPPKVAAAAAPAVARADAPSPLDLKSLETRLRETKAIGVFTKLAVKNQVDELLDRFRTFYQGRLKTTLAELRHSYDLLLLKVLALLQDADPPLASAIAASRESIWGILSNPAKFSTV